MNIRLSQKLAAKLHPESLQSLPLHENPYLDWYAHLFFHDRIHYVIVMNSVHLFTVVFFGKGITSTDRFLVQFANQLEDVCSGIGAGQIFNTVITPEFQNVSFGRAVDKRITGCMNDQIRLAMYLLDEDVPMMSDLAARLNENIFSINDYTPPAADFLGAHRDPKGIGLIRPGENVVPFRRRGE